jgi:phosphate starvation-inducible protein PhoH
MPRKMTRKKQRRLEMQGVLTTETHKLSKKFFPRRIEPKTFNQKRVFNDYEKGKHLFLYGYAGTGKTFLPCYHAIQDVLDGYYEKLIIVRSVVPTRDMGFLPGKQEDKMAVYEAPYKQIFGNLFNRGDAYEILKNKDHVEFMPTSFIRGITLDDAIVLIDECQNMNDHEINSVITRLGDNSKLIICGDIRQTDLIKEDSGFKQSLKIFRSMDSLSMVEFGINDIVRSGFVKDYIIAREEVKDENIQKRSNYISKTQKDYSQRRTSLPEGRGGRLTSISISDNGIVEEVC